MFRFEEPAYLYLLLLLPLLAAFYLYSNYRRRKAIRKFGDPILMAQLMPDVSKYRPDVKFWLVFAAIGLFTVLLARPQFGSKLETVKRQGVEVMIALDISNSMLAQDVQPSRLQKAKRLVAQLVDKMQNDKVGMIVFAGDALPSCLLRVIIFLPRCFGVHRSFADFQARYGNWSCNKSGCPEFYTSRRSGTYCYCHHRR